MIPDDGRYGFGYFHWTWSTSAEASDIESGSGKAHFIEFAVLRAPDSSFLKN